MRCVPRCADDRDPPCEFCKPAEIKVFTTEELTPKTPDDWYWCLHCNRFFQARSLRIDFQGHREQCAFCGAAGLGVDIWPWDAWRSASWPSDTSELHHGMLRR
jgi:hypothetical protein